MKQTLPPWFYDCAYCGVVLMATNDPDEDGGFVFVHNDTPHPTNATFDEEDRPQ